MLSPGLSIDILLSSEDDNFFEWVINSRLSLPNRASFLSRLGYCSAHLMPPIALGARSLA